MPGQELDVSHNVTGSHKMSLSVTECHQRNKMSHTLINCHEI
jgi:hypothetical protein